ncbi:MAG: hypothetical protein HOV80_39530 [Polyangiaceae bacterium]|nr:hypothetical protein [Polyangiaceae bacterium]
MLTLPTSYAFGLMFGLLAAWFTGMLVGGNRRAWWTLLFVTPALLSVLSTVSDTVAFWPARTLDSLEVGAPCALGAIRLWIDRRAINRWTFVICWAALSFISIAAASDGLDATQFMAGPSYSDPWAFGEDAGVRTTYFATDFTLPAMLFAGSALAVVERVGRAPARQELSLTARIGICLLFASHLTRDYVVSVCTSFRGLS